MGEKEKKNKRILGCKTRHGKELKPYCQSEYVGAFNLKFMERELMIKALVHTNGDQKLASKRLNISERNFGEKVTLHKLDKEIWEIKEGIFKLEKEVVEPEETEKALDEQLKKVVNGTVVKTKYGNRLRMTTSKIVKLSMEK